MKLKCTTRGISLDSQCVHVESSHASDVVDVAVVLCLLSAASIVEGMRECLVKHSVCAYAFVPSLYISKIVNVLKYMYMDVKDSAVCSVSTHTHCTLYYTSI